MRNRLLSLLSVGAVLSLLGAQSASAQVGDVLNPTQANGFLIGPVGGINIVAYNSASFPIINSEKDCFTAKNGSDIAPWGGLTLEYPLGNSNELQNFIVGEVLYDSKSSKFTAVNGSKHVVPTKSNGFEADGSVSTALTAQLNYLLFNLAYKYNFTPGPSPVGPGLQVGPSVGLRMTSKFNKTVTVEAASGRAEGDLQSATVTNSTEVNQPQSIRLALRAQFTYDIPFTPAWIATPTVGYDFPITKVDNSRDWRAQSVFGGIAFRYFIRG